LLEVELIEEVPDTSPRRYRVSDSNVVQELFALNSALNNVGEDWHTTASSVTQRPTKMSSRLDGTDTPHRVECSCSQYVDPHSCWRIRRGSETPSSVSTTSQTNVSPTVDMPFIAQTSPTHHAPSEHRHTPHFVCSAFKNGVHRRDTREPSYRHNTRNHPVRVFSRYEMWVDALSSRRLLSTHHRFKCIFPCEAVYCVQSKVFIRHGRGCMSQNPGSGYPHSFGTDETRGVIQNVSANYTGLRIELQSKLLD